MGWRLHRGGRFRAWLGRRFGGDAELGDRLWRRVLHAAGAIGILYLALPPRVFVLVTDEEALLIVLAAVLVLDGLRLSGAIEFPSLRSLEARRPASFSYFAVAIVAALLLFPAPIAVAAIVLCATVDPLVGELRRTSTPAGWTLTGSVLVGWGVAAAVFTLGTPLAVPWAIALGLVAGALAAAAEWPKIPWIDDDLTMVLVPAVVLWILAIALPGPLAPLWGPFT